jgi:transcriptional regulator with XRE-family HTH domain
MARHKTPDQHTGLYYARESRGMSRTELVQRSGISKQQLSRLENGLIRLRLDHLQPFAAILGYSPEQILLWGRYPGTPSAEVTVDGRSYEPSESRRPSRETHWERSIARPPNFVRPKASGWSFPESFVQEHLHASPAQLLVLEATGDSMAPTIISGEHVIVDTGHTAPSPDGLYAIRDTFGSMIVKRLQALRPSRPLSVKVISDNPNHPSEEVALKELEIVGKVVCCLKLF